MKKIVGLWILTVVLFGLTIITPSPSGVLVGGLCGIALGLAGCMTIARVVG